MIQRKRVSLVVGTLLSATLFTACPTGDGTTDAGGGDAGASELQWWKTCGDPVCGGFTAPSDVEACASEVEGEACASGAPECYLDGDECNTRLRCADSDPTQQPGGCPISLPAMKRNIRYLDPTEVDAALAKVLSLKLARYRYRGEEGGAEHLGFLIDETAPREAVLPRGDRVDLYGYTSLAIAAVQAQERRIKALEAELARMKAERQP